MIKEKAQKKAFSGGPEGQMEKISPSGPEGQMEKISPSDPEGQLKKAPSAGPGRKAEKTPSDGQPLWRGYLSWAVRAAVFIAILFLLFTQVLFLKRVDGNQMFPSLKDGDLALGFRPGRSYHTGDVLLYKADGSLHFGRVVAQGGDTVNISGNGSVEINGVTESGEILFPTDDPGTITYPYEVPEGSIFVLGDYRTDKHDSRTYGAIPASCIKGKVLTILRRRGI